MNMTKINTGYVNNSYNQATQNEKTKSAAQNKSAPTALPQEQHEGVELVVPEGFGSKEEFLAAMREQPGHVVTVTTNTAGPDISYSPGVETLWVMDAYSYQGREGGEVYTFYRPHEGTVDPTDRQFYEDAFQFLRNSNDSEYNAKRAEFHRTLDIALKELNEQIAAGKGSGLDTLSAKVKFGNVEMTLAEIHQVHGALSKASSDIWYANNRGIGRVTGHDIAAVYNDAVDTARNGLEKSGLSKEIVDFAADIYRSRAFQARDNTLKMLMTGGKGMDDYLAIRGYTSDPPQLERLYPPVAGVPDYETGYKTDWISKNAKSAEDFFMQAFEYLRDPLDSENYWENRSAFTKQLQVALQDPTKTVAIRGVEMTLRELEKVHEILKNASDGIDKSIKAGHMESLQTMTIYGASVASARMSLSGSGLSREIVALASGVYQNRMDQSMKYEEQLKVWNHNQTQEFREKVMGLARVDMPTDYYAVNNFSFERTSSFNFDAYTKFSNMDVSSADALDKSFNELYNWFKDHMQIWNDRNGGFFKPGQLKSATEKSAFLFELREIFFG